MFLFLSSEDCLDTHPENNAWDFTVDFPKLLHTSGKWECALIEIECDSTTHEDLYVLCDICEYSSVNSRFLPLLRIVNSKGCYHIPYFMGVSRSVVSQLTIYIRNKQLQTPAFRPKSLRCTLQLRPHNELHTLHP